MDFKEAIDNTDEISDYSLKMKPNRNTEDGFCDNNEDVSHLSFKTNNGDIKNIARNQSNDQLSELEHQVENAEVRCDTLKQQLEYMRILYHDRFSQFQNELEKDSDYEESLPSPESDTSSVKMHIAEPSMEQAKDISPKIMQDKPTLSSLPESTVDFKDSSTPNGDFQECNIECQETLCKATSPELTVHNKDVEDNCCTSNHDNFQSLVIGPSDNSFDVVYANNVNLAQNKLIYDKNLLQSMDNDFATETYEKPLNGYNDANSAADYPQKPSNIYIDCNGTMDSVRNSETSNGGNPVETIQGILNGITNSVNIISQLSVNASNSGKKDHTQKHVHKRGTLSCMSKKSVLYNFEKQQFLPENKTVSDFPEENRVLENSYKESRHSPKEKSHRHYHHNHNYHQDNHHHHHMCKRHHNHSHHGDSLSQKSNFLTSDQISVHSKTNSIEELIHDSYNLKQENRFKEHKHKTENRCRERSLNKLNKSFAVKQKSSPDLSRKNPKSKSRKDSRAQTERLPIVTKKEISRRESGGNNYECTLTDLKQERKRLCKVKSTRSQILIRDTGENNQSDNSNCYQNVKGHKKIISTCFLNSETVQKQYGMVSSQSESKNACKIVNNGKPEANKQTSIITEKKFDNNPAPHGLNGKLGNEHISSFPFSHSEESPNFLIPTLSSKLKQVEKPIVNLFNFRNIPFVAGTSTTRSHNLALNLQQALSIIKLRSSSLSIGSDLATEVASSILGSQSRPTSAGSCLTHKIVCPVAVAQMNSKTHVDHNSEYPIFDGRSEKIPFYEGDSATETFDSLSKSEIEAGNFQGSFSHLTRRENVWEVEQVDDNIKSINGSLRCTCFPTHPCTDYQKLLYEYLSNGEDTQLAQLVLPSNDKKETNPSQNISRVKNGVSEMTHSQQKFNFIKDVDIALDGRDHPIYGQIQAHSKELKEVLMNTHRDFIKLNEKYERIHNQIDSPNVNGKKATKELEQLESELEAKENDIAVIVGLHKQLMSLKEQVKALRLKTNSQFFVPRSPMTPTMLPREPTVSVRLTRLLRTIQKFQEKLLNE